MLALALRPGQTNSLQSIMTRVLSGLLFAALSLAPGPGPREAPARVPQQVVVIPVHDEIAKPALYILRRGLKLAISRHADVVILDIKTPGGALDTTFSMMEALSKFHGRTIAYVDNEAMSAGSFISAVTDEIWFAPDGVIGAAAPVTSTGQDVDATMKMKVVSYLKARMRSVSEGKGYRGQVIAAMIDSDTELRVDGQLLKEKGQLLSLTASEAMKPYGFPAQPLLGAGIARDIPDLLGKRFGSATIPVTRLEVTWSEKLAVFLNGLSPILISLGMLALFIEFKTPGFGIFGIVGLSLLAIVFLSSSVAGLSGHEPLILFGIGALLLVLELLFFHSAGFLGVVGFGLMVGSLVWSMADLWPGEPVRVAWSADAFVRPAANMTIGFILAVALAAALIRFLPHGWVWDRLAVGATVGGRAQDGGSSPGATASLDALVGRRGVAVTAIRPAGQVEVDGRRYEAKVEIGALDAGTAVIVRGRMDFGLVVERAE
jgi:membrane-bound serine protease (ClpP class)